LNWDAAGDAFAGIVMLGIFTVAIGSMIVFFVGAANGSYKRRPPRRRRSTYQSRNYYESPEFSYVENPNSNHYFVYFVENQQKEALKLGVGTSGRVLQILKSKVSPDHNAESSGWNVIRLAKFAETSEFFMEGKGNAYEAERRAHFYWRKVLNQPMHLSEHQMGYSQVEMYGRVQWVPTKGYTETAKLNSICEATTWKYVCSSPGFIEEVEWQTYPSRSLSKFDQEGFELSEPLGYNLKNYSKIDHGPNVQRESETETSRFWKKVEKSDNCWQWTGAKNPVGYGLAVFEDRVQPAHRVCWKLEFGECAPEVFLDNKCGNKSCVRTVHWEISVRRKSKPGEIRISPFSCTTRNCGKPAVTMTVAGLCDSCRQRAKRERRKQREAQGKPGQERLSDLSED
jgi:hypothetical protein